MKIFLHRSLKSLLAILVVSCANKPITDSNPDIDFTNYQSFSWVANQPMLYGPNELSPLNKKRIEDSIVKTLQAKGFRKIESLEAADFAVAYSIGVKDKIRTSTHSVPDFYGYYDYPGWGYGYSTRVTQYTEGTLSIEIFDVASRMPAWHGHISGTVGKSFERKSATEIPAAVEAVLESFPPGSDAINADK